MTLLEPEITQENREKYYETLIERGLACPFHSKIHQEMLMNLNYVSINRRNELQKRIWNKFYEERNHD
jgi:hypothetical protein